MRETGYQVGLLRRSERRSRSAEERIFRVFYGRSALSVDLLVRFGDRMPGATGEQVARSVLGRTPDDIVYRPTIRRYPIVAWRFPLTFWRIPRRLQRFQADTDAWYRRRLVDLATADVQAAQTILKDAGGRLEEALTIQGTAAFGVVEPLYGMVEKIIAKAGHGDAGVLSGSGGSEVAGMVTDLWLASRDELGLDEVVRRHGFHGPAEGELSSRVWREDPSPLRRRITDYRALPDDQDPRQRESHRSSERRAQIARILAEFPRWQRPVIRAVLDLAARRIPLRGVAKRGMLQAFDIGRAAANRLGENLARHNVIDEPTDVFYLTLSELLDTMPSDPRATIRERRNNRQRYFDLDLPSDWTGSPQARAQADPSEVDTAAVEGIGVSSGTVDGTARVITDPEIDDIEPGEVLVATTTDPSWAAVMMTASALVVDIGGALSHTAVVARELGIPCVVNTRNGTRIIRSGDHIRVDGTTGTVEILQRSGQDTPKGKVTT